MTAWASASQKSDLPVPDGPQTARFSARPIHSRVRRAYWVGTGIDESASRQVSKVLPAGSHGCPPARRAGGAVAAGDLFGHEDPEDLGGTPALRAGGGDHLRGGGA